MISFPSPAPDATASFLLRAGGTVLPPGPRDRRVRLAHTPLRTFPGAPPPDGVLLVVLRGHVDRIVDALGGTAIDVTTAALPDGDPVCTARVTDPAGVAFTFVGVGDRGRFLHLAGTGLSAPTPVRSVAVRRLLARLDPDAPPRDPRTRASDAFVASAPVLHVPLARALADGLLGHPGVDFLPPDAWHPTGGGLSRVATGPLPPGAPADAHPPRVFADVLHNDLHVDLVADGAPEARLRIPRDGGAWCAFWSAFSGTRTGPSIPVRLYLGPIDGPAAVLEALARSPWLAPAEAGSPTLRGRFSGARLTLVVDHRLAFDGGHPALFHVDAIPDPWSTAAVSRLPTPLGRPLPATLPIDVAAPLSRLPLQTAAEVAEVLDACPDDPDDDALARPQVWAWLHLHDDPDDALRDLVDHVRASVRWAAWQVGRCLGLDATDDLAATEPDPTLRARMQRT